MLSSAKYVKDQDGRKVSTLVKTWCQPKGRRLQKILCDIFLLRQDFSDYICVGKLHFSVDGI